MIGGRVALVAAVAAACGGKPAPVVPRVTPQPVVAPAAAPQPTCRPPRELAVTQGADDGESSRLIRVEVATGKIVWAGPPGSGVWPPVWSDDGRVLAYAVAEDLIVHDGEHADRLVFRGLSDERPHYAFSPDGRWLAATGADGVVAVDMAQGGTLQPAAVATKIECGVDFLAWAPESKRLIAWCPDDDGFQVWDPTTRVTSSIEIDDVDRVLGWWPAMSDAMVVVRSEEEIWAVPLGSPPSLLMPDKGSDMSVIADGLVRGAGIIAYSEYSDDEGYARTIFLAHSATEPPLAWIDGNVFHLSYSHDGAWAVFGSSVDAVDEGGDIMLARVGDPSSRRVLQSPLRDYEDEAALYDETADTEDEGDHEEETLYLGYAQPVPRPDLESRCQPHRVISRETLVRVRTIDEDGDPTLVLGGAILREGEAGPEVVLDGDEPAMPLDPAFDWDDGRRLASGALLVTDGAQTVWYDPAGARVGTLQLGDVESVVGELHGGGLAALAGSREVRFWGADGSQGASWHAPDDIDEIAVRRDGVGALLSNGHIVAVDSSGGLVGEFETQDAEGMTALSDGTIVYVETSYAEDEDDPDADEEWLHIYFAGATGKLRGHYRAPAVGASLIALQPLPDGGVLVVAGEERTKAFFLDANGKPRGTFVLGMPSESPPAVMADGTVALLAYGERDIYLVDSRGRYLGGVTLSDTAYTGPFALTRERLAVEVDDGIAVLERRRR